jgi:hypothetical protein
MWANREKYKEKKGQTAECGEGREKQQKLGNVLLG